MAVPRLQSGSMLTNARVVDLSTGQGSYGLFRIDTGDDIAIIDPSILATIRAQPIGHTDVQGIDGQPLSVPKYVVDVDLGSMGYIYNVECLGLSIAALGYAGLIGDNELDQGLLVRNGPAQSWSFTSSTAPLQSPFGLPLAVAGVGLAAVVTAALWPRQRSG